MNRLGKLDELTLPAYEILIETALVVDVDKPITPQRNQLIEPDRLAESALYPV